MELLARRSRGLDPDKVLCFTCKNTFQEPAFRWGSGGVCLRKQRPKSEL